jgi:hypothetical protein
MWPAWLHSRAMSGHGAGDERMRAHFHQHADEYDDSWLGTGRYAGRDRPGWSEESSG